MFVDVEKYRHHIQSIHLPQDRKDEIIHIIYNILQSFRDRAFGEHPVQQSVDSASQKLAETRARRVMIGGNSINLETKGSAAATTEGEEIP
jgi:hypothetical protein